MSRRRLQLIVALCCLALMPVGATGTFEQAPTAEAIIERNIEVTGGRAAHEKITSLVIRGTIEFAGTGLKGTFVSYRSAPALVYTVSDLAPLGKFEEGSDGRIAWAKVPGQGARLKEGVEKIMALRDAQMHGELRWRESFPTVTVEGNETIDGQPVYRVSMTPKEGLPMTRYYEQQSGLLVRGTVTIPGPAPAIIESHIGDYRKVEPLLVPHRLRQKIGPQEILITVNKVALNEAIPAAQFTPPPDVKALIGK